MGHWRAPSIFGVLLRGRGEAPSGRSLDCYAKAWHGGNRPTRPDELIAVKKGDWRAKPQRSKDATGHKSRQTAEGVATAMILSIFVSLSGPCVRNTMRRTPPPPLYKRPLFEKDTAPTQRFNPPSPRLTPMGTQEHNGSARVILALPEIRSPELE
jgi:hypothetical protein